MVRSKNSRRSSQFRIRTLLTCAVAGVGAFASQAVADVVHATNSSSPLNSTSAWVGGQVPGLTDVAIFDSTMGTSFNTFSLGDNLQSWLGIRLSAPPVGVTISSGNALTLGTSGIDLSNSSFPLTLNNILLLNGPNQSWITNANGGSLFVNNQVSIGGGTVTMGNPGLGGSIAVSGALDNGTIVVAGANASFSGNDNLSAINVSSPGYTTALFGTRTLGTLGIYGGSVTLNSANAYGGAALVLSGGSFDNLTGAPLTLNGSVTLAGNTSYFVGTNNLNLTGNVNLGGVGWSTLTLLGGTTTMSGTLTSSASSNDFIKEGPGQLIYSGIGNISSNITINDGTMTLTGSLTVTGNGGNSTVINQLGNTSGENALLDINGGSLNLGRTDGPYPAFAIGGGGGGNNGAVVRVRNNGVLSSSGQIGVAGNGVGQYGALTLNGGSITTTNGMAVGGFSDYGIMNVYSGVVASSGLTMYISGGGLTNSTGMGIVNIAGGTLTASAGFPGGEMMDVGQLATGILEISSSALLIGGSVTLGGSFTLTPADAPAIVNLRGGTLSSTGITAPWTTNAANPRFTYVNFNGGELRANGGTFLSNNSISAITVWPNGAILDDGGVTAVVGQGLLAPGTGSGVITIPLSSTGTGYLDTPLIQVVGGGGVGATALANVDVNGNFTSITVTNPGWGYTSTPQVNILYSGPFTPFTANAGIATLGTSSSLGGVTKIGGGTLTLRGQSTYAGPTTVNLGTLLLDFITSNNQGVNSNILSPQSTLKINGATVTLNNVNSTVGRSQTVNGLVAGPGKIGGVLMANSTMAGAGLVLNVGALSKGDTAAYVNFNSTFGAQSSFNGITTSNATGPIGGWAVFTSTDTTNLYQTWATVVHNDTTSLLNNIVGMSTASMSSTLTAGTDVNLPAGTYTSSAALSINSLRLNDTAGAYVIDATGNLQIASGGLMLTNSDTATGHSVTIANGILSTANNNDLDITQSNTVNSVTINSAIMLGSGGLVAAGPGLVILNGTASFTGKVGIYGGTLAIASPSDLGAAPGSFVANQLNLAGTLLFNTNDDMGTTRGVSMGGNAVINTNGFNATVSSVTSVVSGYSTSGASQFSLVKTGSGVLTMEGTDNLPGTFTVDQGTVNLTGTMNLNRSSVLTIGDTPNTPAVMIINGGTLNAFRQAASPSIIMSSSINTSSALVLNSGLVTFLREAYIDYGPSVAQNSATSSYAALIINGGTLIHQDYFGIARGQVANSAGMGILQMNGGMILGNASNNFQIGAYQGTANQLHAVAVLIGGTIGERNTFAVGDSLTGIADLLGTNISASTFAIGNGGGLASVANLNAGTVTSAVQFGGTGGLLNFNGGVLQPRIGATTLLANANQGRAYVWGNGANFVNNNTTPTLVSQPILAPDVNGISLGDITQNGTFSNGTINLTLTGGLPAGQQTTAATAVAIVVNNTISAVMVTNPGYGYTSAPTVSFSNAGGTTSIAATTATLQGINLSGTNFTSNTGYFAPPIVNILPATNGTQSGGGVGASAYAQLDGNGNLTGIVVANPGVGYTTVTDGVNTYYPTVTVLGGGGTGATVNTLTAANLVNLASGGAVNYSGTGTITFSSGASNFTGPVNVNSGTMIVSGSFNGFNGTAGLVTVKGGASLTLTGLINGAVTANTNGVFAMGGGGLVNNTVTIANGGSLTAPGSAATITGAVSIAGNGVLDMTGGTIGTLTIASGLTIGSAVAATPLRFDVGNTGADTLAIAGGFTVNSPGSTPITLNFPSLPAPGSVYPLATYTGADPTGLFLTSNSTKFKFDTISLVVGGGSVSISIGGHLTPTTAYWTGQYGNGWDNTDGGVNTNFNSDLVTNAQQYPGTNSTVIFAPPVSGVTPVPLNLNTVLDTGFAVLGLNLQAQVGGVSIANGTTGINTLTIGAGGINNNLSAGGLTVSSNIALGAPQTWVNNDTSSVISIFGNISGGPANGLILGGKININGLNTYSGGTTINGAIGGTSTVVTAGSNTPLGTGTVSIINNGLLVVNGNSLVIGSLSGDTTGVVANNSPNVGNLTITTASASTTTFAGVIQDGSGATLNVRVAGNGTVTLTNPTNAINITGLITVGTGAAAVGTGGILTQANNIIVIGDTANALGSLYVNGGQVLANYTASAPIIIGSGSFTEGVMVLNGGNVNIANELWTAYGPNATDTAASSYGAVVITGGTLTHNTWLGFARGAAANSAGVGYLQMSGGKIDGSLAVNPIQIGAFQGTAGILHAVAVLTGGNIVENGSSGGSGFAVADSNNGIANFMGTNVTASTMFMGRGGGVGIANLLGGIVNAKVAWGGTAGNIINFNGGTLMALNSTASGANGTLIPGSGNGSVYIWGNGAIIDTNGTSSSIAQNLLTPSNGGLSALTISNAGTNYTSAPTVTISGGGGTGATATVVVNTASHTIGTVTITNAGVGYTSTPTVTLSGGGGASGTLTPALVQGVTTIPVNAGGTGYLNAPPVLELVGGGGTGATAIALVGINGAVTGVTITNPGIGYTSAPTVVVRGAGGGTGATFKAATIAPVLGGGLTVQGTGTLTITSGGNTYSGPTNLNSGKLNLTGVISGSPTWNLNNTSLFTNSGTVTASNAINVGSSATLISTGVIRTGNFNNSGQSSIGNNLSASTAINALSGGFLFVNGATLSAPAVIVAGGGSLGGFGQIAAPVTVATGGTINDVVGTVGTLTVTSPMTLASGTNILLDVADQINLGTNPLNSTAGNATIFLNGVGTETPGQSYPIMLYNNTVSPMLALNATYMGFDAVSLSVSNSSAVVNILTVPTAPGTAYFSNNAGTGIWNTVINGQTSNWSADASGLTPVSQLPEAGTDVFLNASNAAGAINYTLGQNFTIHSLNVNNVSGPAVITGVNTLTILGGGLNVSSGGLTISAAVNLGTSQNWVNSSGNTLNITGKVTSTQGNVALGVAGNLFLGATNTFGGSVSLTSGTITTGATNALGNGSVSYLLSSNTMLQLNGFNNSIGDLTGDSTTVVQNNSLSNATFTAGGAGATTFSGNLSDGLGGGKLNFTKHGTGTLTVNGNTSYTGTTTVSNGRLVLSGVTMSATSSQFTVGNVGGLNGVAEVDNSILNVPSVFIGNAGGASGIMQLNNGSVNTSAAIQVGNGSGAYSVLDINGASTITSGSYLVVGQNNDRAIVNMSGGTITFTTNYPTILGGGAAAANGYAVMNISGGSLINNNTGAAFGMIVGEDGSGTFNVSANASVSLLSSLTVGRLATGNGVVNLMGGTITASNVASAGGTSVFNFNGGTLMPLTSTISFANFMTGLSSSYIWTGGANINDNGELITIGQSLLAPKGNGVSSITVTGATGFIDTPMVVISGGGGTGATAVANVDGSGNLTSVTITNPGVGYTSSPMVAVTGNSGAGNSISGTVATASIGSNAAAGGGFNKLGNGTVILTGSNTYTGPTTINAGVLTISSDINLGAASAAVNLSGGALRTASPVVNLAAARNIVVTGSNGVIDSGSASSMLNINGNVSATAGGSLSLIGGGKVFLNANGNNLPIFVGGASGLGGNSNTGLGGTGVINGAVTLNGGELNLLDFHAGTLTLNGGLTQISSAEFRFDVGGFSTTTTDFINASNSLFTTNSGAVTVYLQNLGVAPGTYNLATFQGFSGGVPALAIDGNSLLGADSATANWVGNTLQVTIAGPNVANTAYWSGGAGSSNWKDISGGNSNFNTTYSGGINAQGIPGLVTDVYFAASNQIGGPLSTSLGADLAAKGVFVISNMTNTVTINAGNTLELGSDGLNMQSGAGALTVAANVTLVADQTWSNANSNSVLTVSGVIGGTQNLNLAGNFAINGNNTLIGNIGINSGSITLGNANALGSSNNPVNFGANSHATLNMGANAIAVGGLNGDTTGAILGTGTLTITPVSSANFGGAISGSMGLVVNEGVGTQTLSGTNIYTGPTTINAGGVLRNGSNAALSPNTTVALNGTLDMGGFNGSIANIGSGGGVVTNNGTTAATLTISPGATTTITNVFSDGSAPLGIIKNGTGDLVFNGASMSYTGGLTVNAATVWPLGNGFGYAFTAENTIITALGAPGNTVTLNTGGTLHVLGAGGNGGFLQADWYMPQNFVFAGGTFYNQDGAMPHLGSDGQGHTYSIDFANSTSSTLESVWNTKTAYVDGYLTGDGTVTLTQAGGGSRAEFIFTNTSTQNTFSGQINIDTATNLGDNLYLGGGTSMSTFGMATVDTGGTAQTMTNAIVFTSLDATVQSSVSTLTGAAPIAVSFGALQGSGNFALDNNNTVGSTAVALTVGGKNISTTYGGVMSGTGSLVVSGGTLALTGNNTYAGTTTISAGVLQVGAGGTTGSFGAGNVINNGGLNFNLASALSVPNVITGGGSLVQSGTGTTTITGAANYNGPTQISAGVLQFSGGVSHSIGRVTGTGTLNIGGATTLTSDGVSLLSGTWIINGTQIIRSSGGGGAYAMFAAGNGATALSGTSEVSNLSFGAGAHLDLRNNALIIEATAGTKASLLQAIAGDVTSGAITSSTAVTNPAYGLEVVDNASLGATHFGGLTVDPNSIIVTQALLGDANLDGVVNPSDLLIWANNFNNTGVYSVASGDFNLDGVVNPTDLLIWANNFNNSISGNGVPSIAPGGGLVIGSGGGTVATPEPASLALLGLGATGMLIRRKRRKA